MEGKTCAEVDFSMWVDESEGCSVRQRPNRSRWNRRRIAVRWNDGIWCKHTIDEVIVVQGV